MNNQASAHPSSVSTEPRFIKLPEVLTICSMSKTSVYAAIKRGEFPSPVKLGDSSVWVKGEILGWVESCIAARNAK